jgi:small subunit ribosomal protein S2
MPRVEVKELLDAGVHFGHLKRKWNPAMAPYIFMERSGIHIIDLHKTQAKLEEACNAVRQIARSGRKILFVATKKQAKDIVAEQVKKINMPYVTERWPGGMLTNFPTIRKTIKKMSTIDKMMGDGSYDNLSKRERLQVQRQRAKLDKNFGSIADMTRLPSAVFIVDVLKEYIAVREANILNIPVLGIVDTNSDPRNIQFPIPANDDASKAIALIVDALCKAVEEGLAERKTDKDNESQEEGETKPKKTTKKKVAEAQPEETDTEQEEIDEENNEEEMNKKEEVMVTETDNELEKKEPKAKTRPKKAPAKIKKEK